MMPMLEAKGLIKRYGDRTTVAGVNLVVNAGEVIAVVGPNGAGKSTTIEMMLGLREPDGGTVSYHGIDPRRDIGVQLQSTPFFAGLTAMENLRLFASFYGLKLSKEAATALLTTCKLTDATNTEASQLSGGQQKRLSIALALVHSPRVLFLDEPTAALDPRARHEIRQLLQGLAARGIAILFSSHEMDEVARLATRVVLICQGQVRASGAPADLLAQHNAASLDELYLQLTDDQEVASAC